MNIAIILAGGVGRRLQNDIPKQYVKVFDKPLILRVMELYQKSKFIDAIEVVSVPEYIDFTWQLAKKYNIDKLRWVTEGGGCCQESIKNGIFNLKEYCSDDDLLIFGMSTSIFVTEEILEDSIRVCREYGNAFAGMQCIYNLANTKDGTSCGYINRKEEHKTLNLPWTAPFGTFYRLYKEAYEKNIETSEQSYAPTLFLAMGETIYLSKDTAKNKLHVTTSDDLEIIKGCILLEEREETDEIFSRNR